MAVDRHDDPQRELPERYTPLIEYVSRGVGNPNGGFDSAFRRIEGRRLHAEHELRKTLQGCWSLEPEKLKALRPFDLLPSFQKYAETTFAAAGEECLPLFQDLDHYRSFLNVLQAWVLEAIPPKAQAFERSLTRVLDLETRNHLFEPADLGRLWDRPSTVQLGPLLDDLTRSSPRSFGKPEIEWLSELILRERIIGLYESFSAFRERCPEGGIYQGNSGDWERALDDSLVDVFRTGIHSMGGSGIGTAFADMLKNPDNRESAIEFWTVALEQLHAPLLAEWWRTSADARAGGANADGLVAEAERKQQAPVPDGSRRRVRKVTKRSPKYQKISEALRLIAGGLPNNQEDILRELEERHVPFPSAKPFGSGWMAGFRKDPVRTRAWLSKWWGELNLPPLPRGPKNSKK